MQNKREKFMNNVLELSVNSGKVNENAKYILYSENSKEDKKEKIQETKEVLKNTVENIKNIIYIRIDEMLFWSLVYVEKTAGMDPCHCDLNRIWDTDRGGF